MNQPISSKKSNTWKGYVDAKEFFYKYPWKKVTIEKDGTPGRRPYILAKENTDTPLSVTVVEYQNILKTFHEVLAEYLIEGHVYRFSSDMGELRLVKYKSVKRGKSSAKMISKLRKANGWTDSQAKKHVMENPNIINDHTYYNAHLDGHKFNIAWFRYAWHLRWGTYWNVKLSFTLWQKIWNHYLRNPSDIHKIQDSTKIQHNELRTR